LSHHHVTVNVDDTKVLCWSLCDRFPSCSNGLCLSSIDSSSWLCPPVLGSEVVASTA
jgi:hypothetical protein